MRLFFVCLLTAHLIFISTPSTAEVILSATPEVKVFAAKDSSYKVELTRPQQIENRVVIEKIDGRYYWTTRQNHELFAQKSGNFIIFIDPLGSGYVKINVETGDFLEHVHLGLDTITYWGNINTK
jgi:precorrin-4 methylase